MSQHDPTLDGTNPAPGGRWLIPLQSGSLQCLVVSNSYKLLQDFFHPQYPQYAYLSQVYCHVRGGVNHVMILDSVRHSIVA